MRYIGFSFYLMPESFVIHVPHPVSFAKVAWKSDQKVRSMTSASTMVKREQSNRIR